MASEQTHEHAEFSLLKYIVPWHERFTIQKQCNTVYLPGHEISPLKSWRYTPYCLTIISILTNNLTGILYI